MFVYSFLFPCRIKIQKWTVLAVSESSKLLITRFLSKNEEKNEVLFADINKSRYLCTRK